MSEDYPGQAYVHKHNANIKRAEENAMSEQRAGRGEGLAGLVAQRERFETWLQEREPLASLKRTSKAGAYDANWVNISWLAWKAALEAAAPPSTPALILERWEQLFYEAFCEDREADMRGPLTLGERCKKYADLAIALASDHLQPVTRQPYEHILGLYQVEGHWYVDIDATKDASGIANGATPERAMENAKEMLGHMREALATPSPQAPQEQSKVFSPTSAREQSSATAAGKLIVGDVVLVEATISGISRFEDGQVSSEDLLHLRVGNGYGSIVRRCVTPGPPTVAATQEQPEPTAEHNRLAASLCGCGTSYMSDCERCERIAAALAKVPRSGEQSSGLGRSKGEPFNLSQNAESAPSSAATQKQPAGSAQVVTDLQVALRIVGDWKEDSRGLVHVHKDAIRKAIVAALRSVGNCGSPRKVGEDGAQTFEQWWQAEGAHMVRTTHCTGYELMKEAWNAARTSSVPVGEQKQEEGA